MTNLLSAVFGKAGILLPGLGKCPKWLSEEAREEWRYIVRHLKKAGLITRLDRGALIAYCTAVADLQWAHEAIRKHGYTYTTETGYDRPRPEFQILQAARNTIRAFATELGLSPLARTKIQLAEQPKNEGKATAFLLGK